MNTDRAKYCLATVVVGRFIGRNDPPWKMRDIFSPPDLTATPPPVGALPIVPLAHLLSVYESRTWQHTFIKRLLERGFIKQVTFGEEHAQGYVQQDEAGLRRIFEEVVAPPGGGETIKWLLFPTKQLKPVWLDPPEEPMEDESEQDEEGPPSPFEEKPGATAEVLVDCMSRLLGQFSEFILVTKSMQETMDGMGDSLDELKKNRAELLERVKSMEGKVGMSAERISKLDKTLPSLVETLDQSKAGLAAIPTFYEETRGRLQEVEEAVLGMQSKFDLVLTVRELKSHIVDWVAELHRNTEHAKELTAGMLEVIRTVGEVEHAPTTNRTAHK